MGAVVGGLHAAGKLKVPDDDRARDLYDVTQEICAARGLPMNRSRLHDEDQLAFLRGQHVLPRPAAGRARPD